MDALFVADSMTFWGWLIIGLVLLGFELLAPLTYFLWLGVSALVTSILIFLIPDLSWQVQFLIFSILSVASILISRNYLVGRQADSEVPNLNRRAQQYIGRVFELSEGIQHGVGKIRVDDTHWSVSGPSLKAGSEVRVIGTDGAVFVVEAVDNTKA